MKKTLIGTRNIFLAITTTIAFLTIGYSTAAILLEMNNNNNNVYAQTSEQNEKLQLCFDYKGKDPGDTNRILVNCIEFANSDYDTVEEFVEEEHPELKTKTTPK